jgi:hypothetical protein
MDNFAEKYAYKEYRGRFIFRLAAYPKNKVEILSSGLFVRIYGKPGYDDDIMTILKQDVETRKDTPFAYFLLKYAPGHDWQKAMVTAYQIAKAEWILLDVMLEKRQRIEKVRPELLAMHRHWGETLRKIDRLHMPDRYSAPSMSKSTLSQVV